MVASRHRELFRNGSVHAEQHNYADVENGLPPQPRLRFRDAVEMTMSKQHAMELKKLLLENVDHNVLEKFRKSGEEVYTSRSAVFHCSNCQNTPC